jgi:hypothetical protein
VKEAMQFPEMGIRGFNSWNLISERRARAIAFEVSAGKESSALEVDAQAGLRSRHRFVAEAECSSAGDAKAHRAGISVRSFTKGVKVGCPSVYTGVVHYCIVAEKGFLCRHFPSSPLRGA